MPAVERALRCVLSDRANPAVSFLPVFAPMHFPAQVLCSICPRTHFLEGGMGQDAVRYRGAKRGAHRAMDWCQSVGFYKLAWSGEQGPCPRVILQTKWTSLVSDSCRQAARPEEAGGSLKTPGQTPGEQSVALLTALLGLL